MEVVPRDYIAHYSELRIKLRKSGSVTASAIFNTALPEYGLGDCVFAGKARDE